jgi:hypothetical protein
VHWLHSTVKNSRFSAVAYSLLYLKSCLHGLEHHPPAIRLRTKAGLSNGFYGAWWRSDRYKVVLRFLDELGLKKTDNELITCFHKVVEVFDWDQNRKNKCRYNNYFNKKDILQPFKKIIDSYIQNLWKNIMKSTFAMYV